MSRYFDQLKCLHHTYIVFEYLIDCSVYNKQFKRRMGGKRKLNLQIECEGISEMEKSVFSEIGSDGLRFLREGVHIGP